MQRHRVLNLMTHVDPWKRSDLDHAAVLQDKRSPTVDAVIESTVIYSFAV